METSEITLLYNVYGKDKKKLGKLYVRGCPDEESIVDEKLQHPGEEPGYNFVNILQVLFSTVVEIELVTASTDIVEDDRTCIVPWTLICAHVNQDLDFIEESAPDFQERLEKAREDIRNMETERMKPERNVALLYEALGEFQSGTKQTSEV